MTERVWLTGRCERRRHILFTLIETDTTLDVVAPLVCYGREADTWAPGRRQLDPLNGHVGRYGCACRRSALIRDKEIWKRLRRGSTEWVIATTNISER